MLLFNCLQGLLDILRDVILKKLKSKTDQKHLINVNKSVFVFMSYSVFAVFCCCVTNFWPW